jgi:outer membrane immunogenic protein
VSAVSAADLSTPYQPRAAVYSPASAFNWSGFYAGANVGYGWADMTAGGPTQRLQGLLGGVQAGYNYDLGGVVLGIEADLQLSGVRYSETAGAATGTFSVDQFGTLRGRVGLAADRFLPYVTGGLAVANNHISINGGGANYDESKVSVGWTIGGGVEFAATDNITLKAEYLYADFGKASFAGPAGLAAADVTTKASIVRTGVNFKF